MLEGSIMSLSSDSKWSILSSITTSLSKILSNLSSVPDYVYGVVDSYFVANQRIKEFPNFFDRVFYFYPPFCFSVNNSIKL